MIRRRWYNFDRTPERLSEATSSPLLLGPLISAAAPHLGFHRAARYVNCQAADPTRLFSLVTDGDLELAVKSGGVNDKRCRFEWIWLSG
jgi:hypothetical protein